MGTIKSDLFSKEWIRRLEAMNVKFYLKTVHLCLLSTIQKYVHVLYIKLFPYFKTANQEYVTILIIQLGQIGDFVLSETFFRNLRKHFGTKLNLIVLIDKINEELAINNPDINEIVIYNSSKYTRSTQIKFPSTILKQKNVSLAVWLRGDFHVFLWIVKNMIPLKSVITFPNPLRWAWLPLITKKPIKKYFCHYLECLQNIYKDIVPGKTTSDHDFYIPRSLFSNNEQEIIFIHVSSGNKLRQWPEDRFCQLCEMLVLWKQDISIQLIGSCLDFEFAEKICIKVNSLVSAEKVTNTCGKLKLSELSQVFKRGKLFIGFDSGPMHVAVASGIPMVVLMGPQSPQIFSPRGNQDIKVIYKNLFCSPCWQFSCLHVNNGPGACVTAIQPKEVFDAAKAILTKGEYYER